MCGLIWLNRLPPEHPFQYPFAALAIPFVDLFRFRGTVIAFCLYGVVSVLGVLAFGVAEGQKDSLILDLTPARKQVHVLISLLAAPRRAQRGVQD